MAPSYPDDAYETTRVPEAAKAPRRLLHAGWIGVILVVLSIHVSPGRSSTAHPRSHGAGSAMPLPGQQTWKGGVSSYVFGTVDSYEAAGNTYNIVTSPPIRGLLRVAGFPLVRTFLRSTMSMAEIDKRIAAIEDIQARCLAVIDSYDPRFALNLVRHLGNRCLMYEYGNEPDVISTRVPVATYLARWNAIIPQLRRINPRAVFMGPTLSISRFPLLASDYYFIDAFLAGVRASGVLPDAITFHWYPCYNFEARTCLILASSIGQIVGALRAHVESALGRDLPIGVTEWNFAAIYPIPAAVKDPSFIRPFTTIALHAMMQAGVALACQFDAASAGTSNHKYPVLDMINTAAPLSTFPQFDAMRDLIRLYRIGPQPTVGSPVHLAPTVKPAPLLAAAYRNSAPRSWLPGQTQQVHVIVTNVGTETWQAAGLHPIRLGVHFGIASDFPYEGWATNQWYPLTRDVPPGASQELTVGVTAPVASGTYILRIQMFKEHARWFTQIDKTTVAVRGPHA